MSDVYRIASAPAGSGPQPASRVISWSTSNRRTPVTLATTIKHLAIISLLSVCGCVTSHVIVGKVRPPIAPDQVQLYLHPPATKYEEIALLESSSKNSFSFTAQGKTNAVIERMKNDAAKLGANGILLEGVGDKATGSV